MAPSHRKWYRKGLKDGIPIGLGYFAVALAMGIAARNAGLTAVQATVTSLLINASAGQYVGFTLMAARAGLLEIALMESVANARYLLMSCALSQKLPPDTPLWQRMVLGFDVTDEIFGVSISVEGKLDPFYTFGAMTTSIPGWALGTFLGVVLGHAHPMKQVLQQIKDLFVGMGYQIVDGPEVELADYNFTKLNIEEGHPSRDRSDTFYFTDDDSVLLRTQTSPMQIRVMENAKPPICILAPGRVYRKDEADATHSPMFHQIEGLVIDEHITMGDLKGALVTLMKKLYGEEAVMRFRPHHFPFTEPSCEMDMQCHKCHGTGEVDGGVCSTCHGEGWIELLGAGMVHPKVLEGCGIDPEKYSGFAFGMGLERMAMRRTRINDLRLIFENDVRFLNQF